MSDYKPNIYLNIINRRNGRAIKELPIVNRLTINKDIRQLCDSFDFDIEYGVDQKIDLKSHDFVEFYTLVDGKKFQITAGFIEDFTKDTSAGSHKFQANGRDFLGQLLSIPFLNAKPLDQTTLPKFVETCLDNTYLVEYLNLKGIQNPIIEAGGYPGPVNVPELSSAKRGPVLQQTSDEVYTTVYQNRFGQVVLYGRDHKNDISISNDGKRIATSVGNPADRVISYSLNELKDQNVMKFTVRENHSKVFSQVKIFYTGAEGNVSYGLTPSNELFNSDPKARQIFQPEFRTFQSSTLILTAGSEQNNLENKRDQLAASILRKSNQHLLQVVIKTNRPFYITPDGINIPYEVNQIWPIRSTSFDISESMRLVGISYSQQNSGMDVELMFIPRDTLT